DEFASDRAALWQKGLASWEQPQDRLQRLRDAAEVTIYTPGSDAGLPLTILKSFDAPPPEVRDSVDAMRERVMSAVSGLLTLLGIDADPLRSREHILLSNILDNAWRQGRNLDMPALIREIQQPPFQKVGIMDLETIFPAKDRMELAMTINNVLASPGFAAWTQGEPLNIQRLLYTPEGKPRLTVLSIAHLNDAERMFFVTILLNEVLAWMRTQSGTSSLRAILYMDEVFGYLPPTANPPSKMPMLTLLKQARAFGLGLVLATQNPVDLDYKALSNAGTWFLGRLQTERDKLRVLDGLEGASANAGVSFDRQEMEKILSAVGSRVFLLNNVHDDHPVIFQTRWALSYLRGPLTRAQIAQLMDPIKQALPTQTPTGAARSPGVTQQVAAAAPPPVATPESLPNPQPILPPEIPQKFAEVARRVPREASIDYVPALLGRGKLHFVDSKSDVDIWQDVVRMVRVGDEVSRDIWIESEAVEPDSLMLTDNPVPHSGFQNLPSDCTRTRSFGSLGTALKDNLYREERLVLSYCPELKLYSKATETEGDFRARLKHQAHEQRDLELEKLRTSYGSKFESLQEKVRKAEQRIEIEKQQASSATMSAAISFGTSVLGALFGRKTFSSTNLSKVGTSARAASRAAEQRGDIRRAEENLESILEEKEGLEKELEQKIDELQASLSLEQLTIEEYEVTPRKSDVDVAELSLLWLPYTLENGTLAPAFD
ncbi:MAG: ATP-binding protein, partial [Planctomycetaceae bacterium]|nr:ATP-binding protein [Planctomycetaceae bacterium]